MAHRYQDLDPDAISISQILTEDEYGKEKSYLEEVSRLGGPSPGFEEGGINAHDLSKWIRQLLEEGVSRADVNKTISNAIDYLKGLVESGKISSDRAVGLARVLSIDLKLLGEPIRSHKQYYSSDTRIEYNLDTSSVNDVLKKFQKFQPLTKENIARITNEIFLDRLVLDEVREIVSDHLIEEANILRSIKQASLKRAAYFLQMVNSSFAQVDRLSNMLVSKVSVYNNREVMKQFVLENKRYFLQAIGETEESGVFSPRYEAYLSEKKGRRDLLLSDLISELAAKVDTMSSKMFDSLNSLSNILTECTNLFRNLQSPNRGSGFFLQLETGVKGFISDAKAILEDLSADLDPFLQQTFLLGEKFYGDHMLQISDNSDSVFRSPPKWQSSSQSSGAISQGDFFINAKRTIDIISRNMDGILTFDFPEKVSKSVFKDTEDMLVRSSNLQKSLSPSNFLEIEVEEEQNSIAYTFSVSERMINNLGVLGLDQNKLDEIRNLISQEMFERGVTEDSIIKMIEPMILDNLGIEYGV